MPSQFGELSKKANASLQSALQRCRGVEAPFAKVQRIVLHGGNGEGGGDSFVQTSRRVLEWGAIGQVSEAILAERGDPAKADASAMVAELNDAVKQATEQLSAFTDSFGEGFASLSSAVQETTKGKLSDDMVAKVFVRLRASALVGGRSRSPVRLVPSRPSAAPRRSEASER